MRLNFFINKSFSRAGFTLIEILIAMSIFGVIIAGMVYFALDISQLQIFLGESLESEEDIKQVLEIMIPEIRSMAASSNGSYPVVSASSSSFTFFSDINSDGLVEKIRYFLDNKDFKKGLIVPTLNPVTYDPTTEKIVTVVSDVISANIFYYYDGAYDGSQPSLSVPVDISQIRLIKIVLIVDKNPLALPLPIKINTFIDIRNLRGL